MALGKRIFVAGGTGLVGGAIVRRLASEENCQVLSPSRSELDLEDEAGVRRYLADERPDTVILAAALVGGIGANRERPVEFLTANLAIQNNVMLGSQRAGVGTLMFLGSSCIYPRAVPQPMREDALLTGVLEPTNEPYAVAKIAGIKLCESYNRQHGVDYRSVMPTNLYGPGDNFHPENSHVLPALIRRFHEARRDGLDEVVIWGTGKPRREFLHVDDMAAASLFVMDLPRAAYEVNTQPMLSHINVGCGEDISIAELAAMVAKITGFTGRITQDVSKPDGTMRKLMDVSRLADMGWRATIRIEDGIRETYAWFLEQPEAELRAK